MNEANSYPPKPLLRSDTLEELEPPAWSNHRPVTGPTPLPPRNEPLLFIPEDGRRPTLLKLLYLANSIPANSNTSETMVGYGSGGGDTSPDNIDGKN